MTNEANRKPQSERKASTEMDYHKMEVTRTEWSAEPVMNMGSVGCQSTLVIAAL